MSWSPINVLDVEAALNEGELAEYRKHCAQVADPLPEIINQVVGLVRGKVAVRSKLEAEGIPSELMAPAVDIVIYRLAKRVEKGGDGDLRRKDAADDAMKILDDVAKGLFGGFDEQARTEGSNWGSETKFSPR